MTASPDAAPRTRPGTAPRRWIVLVHTVTFRQARQFVPAVIPHRRRPPASAAGRGRSSPSSSASPLLSLLTAALSWWRFSYADGPAAVVVTRGLLSRSVRTVPNDRIRGVEVEAPPLHRLFGLVRVRIDAAAGAAGKDEELLIDGVPRAEGDRLRAAVLSPPAPPPRRPAPADAAPPEPARGGGRPASTTAGCCTPRWSAATWPSRWPRSARCSGSPTSCPSACAPSSTAPTCPTGGCSLIAAPGRAAAAGRRRGGRRRRRQLGVPAGPPRRVADRRPRPAHPAAHRAGDRPHPRLHGLRGRWACAGCGRRGSARW